jgi:hypothetical protein
MAPFITTVYPEKMSITEAITTPQRSVFISVGGELAAAGLPTSSIAGDAYDL